MDEIDAQIKEAPLSYEEAKEQFVAVTAALGLKHTFTFDEAWETAKELRKRNEYRDKVLEFQKTVESCPEAAKTPEEIEVNNPLKHTFADGMYIREVINRAGQLVVTKIHKQKHPFFLMEGEMNIVTEDGVTHVKAPHYGITQPGTKRIIFAITDCKFVTVHSTDKTDIAEIEEDIIAKDFSDPVLKDLDCAKLKELSV
jgi:hypothetical protein